MLPVCDRAVHVGVALALELKSHKKRTESTAAVAFALTFSRPIYELSDEEMRIATTGQGRDVIE